MAPTTRSQARVVHKVAGSHHTEARVKKAATRKNTKSPRRSLNRASGSGRFDDGMDPTQQNSLNSPLLRLPAEIRNMIWNYAVGGLKIMIRDKEAFANMSQYERNKDYHYHNAHAPSNIQLHKVCKQTHAEVTPLMYTLNTFCCYYLEPFDKWMKNRSSQQMQLVTSIRVPIQYFRLYSQGFRDNFCERFPNLKRLGLNEILPCLVQDMGETSRECEAKIVEKVQEREGENLSIEWYAWPSSDWNKPN